MRNLFKKLNQSEVDRMYLGHIQTMETNPVFIMGLHRSGTTFLYDTVSTVFGLPGLDLYHVTNYSRLIHNYLNNTEQYARDHLNETLKTEGITTRGIDNVEINDRTVEEYGWLLSYRCHFLPNFELTNSNSRYLREVCRKLQFINGDLQSRHSSSVIMKNPFDALNGETILREFPNAKFIYITRPPAYILNSCINAGVVYGEGELAYLRMLLKQTPLGELFPRFTQWYYNYKGRDNFIEKTIKLLLPIIAKDISHYQASIVKIPEKNRVVVDYDDFVDRPSHYLNEISERFSMSFEVPPETIQAVPRAPKLLPQLQTAPTASGLALLQEEYMRNRRLLF